MHFQSTPWKHDARSSRFSHDQLTRAQKISRSKRGKPLSEANKQALRAAHPHLMGDKSPNWQGGKTLCKRCSKKIGSRSHKTSGHCRPCGVVLGLRAGTNNPAYRHGNGKNNTYWSRKRRAREYALSETHTEIEWQNLKTHFRNICLCCKRQEPEITLTRDHIIPLARGGTDKIDNIQPLCKSCNCRKWTHILDYRPQVAL